MYAWVRIYAKPLSVLFVSSTLDVFLNPTAGSVTDHSRLAKCIDPYFKSQLYVDEPGDQKWYSFNKRAE